MAETIKTPQRPGRPISSALRVHAICLAGILLGCVAVVVLPLSTRGGTDPQVAITLKQVLDWRLDSALFLIAVCWSLFIARAVVRQSMPGSSLRTAIVLGAVLLAAVSAMAIAGAEFAARYQRDHYLRLLKGFAPTYADELGRLGHARLPLSVKPTDPRYIYLIEAEKRWLRVNRAIADIYTMRKVGEGSYVYFVDSETDYDGDGQYVGEREQRTAPGEPVEEPDEFMARAFRGEQVFVDTPQADRWGTWIAFYEPMRGVNGEIEGILGIDVEASEYLTSTVFARAAALAIGALLAGVVLGGVLFRVQLAVRAQSAASVALARDGLAVMIADRTRELETANATLRGEIDQRRKAEQEREQINDKFQEAYRRAGMAEVATGVLHNVGNVLNSVNVSAGVIAEKLKASKVSNLGRAAKLLLDHGSSIGAYLTEDPKGKQLPTYLESLAEFLCVERSAMLEEIELLVRNVDHIKQIVTMQQSFAKMSSVSEEFDVGELIDDALSVEAASLERHGITVRRRIQPVPRLKADKHTILQILVNLIANAKHAVLQTSREEKQIAITLFHSEAGECGRVVLQVIDNGLGISPESMAKIFSHGFTTRKEGHGFGLHASANAAKQMGGSLTAHSDGIDRGAVFTLEVPLAPPTVESAVAAEPAVQSAATNPVAPIAAAKEAA